MFYMTGVELLIPLRIGNGHLVAVQRRQGLWVLAQKMFADVVHSLPTAPTSVFSQRNSEYRVQLLKGQALGFGQKKEHHEEAYDVPGRVPAKGALHLERGLHKGP